MERAAAIGGTMCASRTSMNCKEYTELLQSYVDADLDGMQECAMEAHQYGCYACAEALEGTRSLFQLLDRLERDEAPEGIVEAVLRQLPRDSGATRLGSQPSQRLRLAGVVTLAAGAVATLAILLLLGAMVSPSHWSARLGTLATWWVGWLGDLTEFSTWLRTASQAEVEPAMRALLRAAVLLLQAGAVPLLACWSAATLLGLGFARHPGMLGRSFRSF